MRCLRNRLFLPMTWLVVCYCVVLGVMLPKFAEAQQPSFETEPSDTEVKPGMSGELKCVIKNMPDSTHCFWKKDDELIEISERYIFTNGGALPGDCSITITGSILQMDDGWWTCGSSTTSSNKGIASRRAKYTVLEMPKEPIILQDSRQLANASEMIINDFNTPPVIECRSENGNPAANLIWTNANNMQPLQGNYTVVNDTMKNNKTATAILRLQERMDDSWQNMILVCVATHSMYDGINHLTYVTIHEPQSPIDVQISTDYPGQTSNIIEADTKDSITLFCHATAYPAPYYRWKNRLSETDSWKDYQPYNTSPNITFMAFETQFMCEATNDNGQTYVPSGNIMTINVTSTKSSQIGTLIAIVVVCIVLVVLAGAGIYTCYKKKLWPFKVPKDKKKTSSGDENLKPANPEEPKTPVISDDHNEETRESLMAEENEKRGDVKTDSSPQVRRKPGEITYASLDLHEQNGNKNHKPAESNIVYAQIKSNS